MEPNTFRDKLYNHSERVPTASWERIEAALPPEKDKLRYPLFWFFLFASLLAGGTLMVLSSKWNQPASVPEPPQEQPTLSLNAHSNTVATSGSPNTAIPVSTDEHHSPYIDDNTHISTAFNETSASKAKQAGLNKSTRHAINTATPPAIHPGEHAMAHAEFKLTDSENANAESTNRSLVFVEPLSRANAALEHSSSISIEVAAPTDLSCYKFSKTGARLGWSLDLFAGPGWSPNSFEANNAESSVYRQARETTERNQYAWTAGARVNLHFRNGLKFSSGIQYDQVGDIFDYTDTLATQSTTRIDSFFSADGTFLYADTNRILVFGTLIKKIHNTYRFLDIPLLIGYELPLNRSLLFLHAGPVINVASSHEGQILDPMLHPRSITEGANNRLNAYKTKIGVSLYLGAGLLLPMTEQLSFLVEPRLTYRMKSITLDGYPLNEKRHNAALQLGLRYHL